MHDDRMLAEWLEVGVKRTASGGTFTFIVGAERIGEVLAVVPSRGISIYPLWPRAGEAAKRLIVQVLKGARTPPRLLSGLILHERDGSYTKEADAILRGAGTLSL